MERGNLFYGGGRIWNASLQTGCVQSSTLPNSASPVTDPLQAVKVVQHTSDIPTHWYIHIRRWILLHLHQQGVAFCIRDIFQDPHSSKGGCGNSRLWRWVQLCSR
eukprot:448419_1